MSGISRSDDARRAAPGGAEALRARLRSDLVPAMKARDRSTVSALRSAIAALDNAEAVAIEEGAIEGGASAGGATSEHVAGTRSGVGAAETARRELSTDEARAVVRAQIDERRAEADRCVTYGRQDRADELRREADALEARLA